MEEARCRHGNLRGPLGERANEGELLGGDAAGSSHTTVRVTRLPCDRIAVLVREVEERFARYEAVERPDEARRPGGAAKLAVADRMETRALLEPHGFANEPVLNLAQASRQSCQRRAEPC